MNGPAPVSSSGEIPVFPLPDVVFFPRTVLPLHVFEPRYRTMVRDAMRGEKLIAVSLLKPGWQAEYHRSPDFFEIGTVGRIEDLEPLEDGRFNMRLVGLQRGRLGNVIYDRPYRIVRVTPLPETPVDEGAQAIVAAKLNLLASHGCLLRELTSGGPGLAFDDRVPFEAAVNGACASLPVEPAIRQSLLEEDDLLARQRRVTRVLDEVLERVLRLKALRSRDEGGSDLN